MMTAEQFHRNGYGHTLVYPIEAYPFAEAYHRAEAAAQLAELRKESAIAEKYEQKLLRELGRVMTALRCTDEFDGPDEAVRTANELVQALGEADKIRAELGFADTTPLNVWLADLRAQLAEKEREIARLKVAVAVTQPTFEDLTFREAIRTELIIELYARAEAEAQALNKRQMEAQLAMAESLRQREAELEEAQAETEIRDELINVIKGESPVAPLIERLRQRWISVRDRLPEEHGQYLVWVHGAGNYGDMVSVTTEARFDKFNWFMEGGWLSDEVQGWQPLPSPPKEG